MMEIEKVWSDWCFRKTPLTAGDRWGMGMRGREEPPLNDWEHLAATCRTEK